MENTSWAVAFTPTDIRITPISTPNSLIHMENTSWAVALIPTYIFMTQSQYTNDQTTNDPRSTVLAL